MSSPWKSLPVLLAIINCAKLATVSLTANEVECYSQKKVYDEKTGKCYKLLTTGPCGDREWLVLEIPRQGMRIGIHPVCMKERCNEGEYYWLMTGSCVRKKDSAKFCSESRGEEMINNVFGEGECSCTREPPRMRLMGDMRNPCYQIYTRGPCNYGEIFTPLRNETEGGSCKTDPCHQESIKRKKNGSISKDGILAPSENGTCYELGTQGPCDPELVFKIHTNLLEPRCVSLTTAIFNIDKPGCYQDENGDCQKRVPHKKKGAQKFKEELLNTIRRKRFVR